MKIALNGTFQTTDATYLPLPQINSPQIKFEAVEGVLKPSEVPTRVQIESYIRKEAIKNNLPPSWAVNIAVCESGLNPKAKNEKDTDGLPAFGLYQFKETTFKNAGGKDIWDWKEQTQITMRMLKNNKWKSWPMCTKHFSSGA